MATDSLNVKDRPGHPAGTGSEPAKLLRILLVDDHSVVRQGLKQVLRDKFPEAEYGEARNAPEALARLSGKKWDVMLLDINMPGPSGLDVLNQVRAMQPEVKVLVLTMHPEDQYALRVLKSGASGYITKESAPEQLVNAVTKVLAGGKYISATLAESLAGRLSAPAEKLPHESLSDREYQIMRMMALGKSLKEISSELSLSVKTISTYRTRLLQKMRLKTNAEIIRYALRESLVD